MNIFKQLIVSLYSPKDISNFRQQKMGKTILYVFLLTLLSVLPSIYHFATTINNGIEAIEYTVKHDLPSFTIENGELQADKSSPITINKNDFTIVFDSTGTIDQADVKRAENTIFFLKNELAYSIAGESQSLSYSMFSDITITKNDLLSFLTKLDSFLPFMIPATSAIIYIISAAMKFIEVTIVALFGISLKNLLGKNITYGHLWKLSAYSITLPTVFFAIMEGLKTVVPGGFFIHWFVTLSVLLLVIKEIPSQSVSSASDKDE